MKSFRKTTQLYSWLTRTNRSCVDIEWSKESFVHNFFRAYELVVGRKYGIRCEVVFSSNGDTQFVEYHTFEAMCGFFEQRIRQFLKGMTPKIIKVYIPVLSYVGVSNNARKQPYLFAIAFDATGSGGTPGNGTASASFTISGSERGLVAFGTNAVIGDNTAFWNTTESLTQRISGYNNPFIYGWTLVAPSTGAHALTMATTGTKALTGASYTGLNQTDFLDASNTDVGADPSTSGTLSLTVVASDCWIIAAYGNAQNRNPTITSYTARANNSQDGASCYLFDSNGTVSTGSNSLSYTWDNTNGSKMFAMSIKPPTVAGVSPRSTLLTLGVG